MPSQPGDKAIIQNQYLMISALQKIEMHSETIARNTSEMGSPIGVSSRITSGETGILTELKTHTKILLDISKKINSTSPKSSGDGGVVEKLAESNKATGAIGNIASILVVLGGAFLVFSKGLSAADEIDPKQVIILSVAMITTFGAIAFISKNYNSMSLKDSIVLSLMMVMLAETLVAVSRSLSKVEDVSPRKYLTAIAIAAAFVPLTTYFIQSISQLFKNKGIMGSVANVVEGGLVTLAAAGALLIMPILALVIAATSRIILTVPSDIDPKKYITLAMVSASIIPLAYSFKLLFTAIRGDGSGMLMRAAGDVVSTNWGSGMMQGGFNPKQAMLSTLGIIPALALVTVITAWIFKMLPNKFVAPPLDWSFKVGLSLFLFSTSFSKMFTYLKYFQKEEGTGIYDIASRQELTKSVPTISKVGTMFGLLFAMSIGIVATAWMMHGLPSTFKAPPLDWVFKAGIAMFLFAKAVVGISQAIRGKSGGFTFNFGSNVQEASTTVSPKALLLATAAIPLIGIGIITLAHLFKAFPADAKLKAPPLIWTVKVGLAMFLFSKAMQSLSTVFMGDNKLSIKDLLLTGAMLSITALSVVGVAMSMMMLPSENALKAPPIGWTLKVGLAMFLFSFAVKNIFGVISGKSKTPGELGFGDTSGKIGLRDIILTGFALVAIAASVVGTAWAMLLLPPSAKFKAPPLWWTIKTGLAMALFAISVKMIANGLKGMKFKEVLLSSVAMVSIAIGLVGVAYTFMALPPDNLMKSPPLGWILKTGIAMALFAISFSLLMKTNIDYKQIPKATIAFMAISLGIVGIAWQFSLLPDEFKTPPIEWILTTALSLAVFGLAFWLVGKFGAQTVVKGSLAMLAAAAVLPVVGLGVKLFADSLAKIDSPWEFASQMAAIVIGLGAVMFIAGSGPMPGFISAGSAAMLIAASSLAIIGTGILQFAKAWEIVDNHWEFVAQVMAVITGLGLSMAAAGIASPFILAGSAAMLVAGGALSAIGIGIKNIAEVYADSSILFDASSIDPSKTNIQLLVHSVADSMDIGVKKSLSIYTSAPAIIFAGTALISIAKGLSAFTKIIEKDISISKLASTIQFTTTVLADTFASIGEKYGGSGLTGTIFSIMGTDPVSKGIRMTKGMGRVLTSLARGISAWANLTFIEDGKKTQLKESDFQRVSGNIILIVKSLTDTFGEIGSNPDAQSDWWLGKSNIQRGIDQIQGMGEPLYNMAKAVQMFATMTYMDTNGNKVSITPEHMDLVGTNIKKIIQAITGVLGEIGASEDAQTSWWFGKSNIDKGVKAIQGYSEDLVNLANFVDKIVGMDLSGKVGEYDNNGKLIKQGLIEQRTLAIVRSITGALAAVGGDESAKSSGWNIFSSNAIEKGKDAIKGIAEDLNKTVSFVERILGLDASKIDKFPTIFSNITMGLMNGLKSAADLYDTNENDIDKVINLFENLSKGNFSKTVDKLSKTGNSLDKVAKSFKSIATSMQDFSTSVNKLDTEKLENLNKTYDTIKEIYKFSHGQKIDIGEQVADGIEQGISRALDLIESFKEKETTRTSNTVQRAQQPVIIERGETKVNVDNTDVVTKLNELIRVFESDIDVNVTNANIKVQSDMY